MIVEPHYRGHRIEVNAVAVDERWNADVRIRRVLSQDKPHAETVTCYKLTAAHAERAGEIWAKRGSTVTERTARDCSRGPTHRRAQRSKMITT